MTVQRSADRPLVLVTNDDGIEAVGLWLLAQAAASVADTVVVAPARPQSWMGRAHLSDPLPDHLPADSTAALSWQVVPPAELLQGRRLLAAHAVASSPARCLRVALDALSITPDLVVSGLNAGNNVGAIVTCSGTLGAAWEAADSGLMAAAFSRPEAMSDDEAPVVVPHLTRIITRLLEVGLPEGAAVLNANFPAQVDNDTPWTVTRTSSRSAYEHQSRQTGHVGERTLWQMFPVLGEAHGVEADSDIAAVQAGQVSLTFWPSRVGLVAQEWV